jgi:hypothetical protein
MLTFETFAYVLLTLAAALVAYSLGRMHERRRCRLRKQEITAEEMYLGAQIELKRIQFEVKRSRSNEEFNSVLQRLRAFFDEHFELRELYTVNAAFCRDWLDRIIGVMWDDSAKLRFREDVGRLRAE